MSSEDALLLKKVKSKIISIKNGKRVKAVFNACQLLNAIEKMQVFFRRELLFAYSYRHISKLNWSCLKFLQMSQNSFDSPFSKFIHSWLSFVNSAM